MPLRECPPFADVPPRFAVAEARQALDQIVPNAERLADPVYLGFAPAATWQRPVRDAERTVDAFFGLQRELGFETQDSLLTFGVRASRFALVVFWEALHVLRTGGVWIDIDDAEALGRSAIGAGDVLARPYFAHCLECLREVRVGPLVARFWRKRRATLAAADAQESSWTFGILVSGPSPRACRMMQEIHALGLPDYEIVLCGPEPGPAPPGANVRRIDLDRPEPRGWITRKKNLIAEAARGANLCLLHDRFRLPANFADAVDRTGPAAGITTFPQLYFPEPSRSVYFRNVDYQDTRLIDGCLESSTRLVNFRLDQFAYPQYNDWRETVHVNGGAYLTRRALWRAVPQDEALFHGDWEDIVYGIACHRFGIPQRVNPHAVLESVYSHHSLLAHLSLPRIDPDGAVERRQGAFSAVFLAHRLLAPERMKPLGRLSEKRLRNQVRELVPRLPAALRAPVESALAAPIRSMASWWALLRRTLRGAKPESRDEASALLDLLWRAAASPVWHPNYVQLWLRGLELDDGSWERLLEREERSFALWQRLYPAFFEPEGATAIEPDLDRGPQRRRRALQARHWRSKGSRGLVHSTTSLGEQPRLELLPDAGEPAPWRVAAAVWMLRPIEYILSSTRVQRALERAARFGPSRAAAHVIRRLREGAVS